MLAHSIGSMTAIPSLSPIAINNPETATAATADLRPIVTMQALAATSHRRTVRSRLPVTRSSRPSRAVPQAWGVQPTFWRDLVGFPHRAARRAEQFVRFARSRLIKVQCGSTGQLSDFDHFLRKFIPSENHLTWDLDNKCWLPSPAALQFDPGTLARCARRHVGPVA